MCWVCFDWAKLNRKGIKSRPLIKSQEGSKLLWWRCLSRTTKEYINGERRLKNIKYAWRHLWTTPLRKVLQCTVLHCSKVNKVSFPLPRANSPVFLWRFQWCLTPTQFRLAGSWDNEGTFIKSFFYKLGIMTIRS